MTVYRLRSVVQNYAWGHTSTLARLQGREPGTEPEAELWVGAHPSAPSQVEGDDADPVGLDEFLAGPGASHLPDGVTELPFLLKILAIGGPLSIQVHPDAAQARAGFDRDEAAGLDVGDPTRSYKDASDKPEVVVALEPMRVLVGLQDADELSRLADEHDLTWLKPLADGSPSELVTSIFALSDEATEDALDELAAADLDPERARLVEELLDDYPGDRGVLVAACMNLIHLQPGEALFTDAGVLHAYVSGTAVEIMNPSDNVLRAGLTPKHIDTTELARILRSDQRRPEQLTITESGDGGLVVPLWTDQVGLRHYTGSRTDVRLQGLTVALATAPSSIEVDGTTHEVPSGQAVLVLGDHRVDLTGDLWLAGCPATST
ncbi:MAG: mannose-6-phosphate isomerase, class I [Mobilicoccus sp.]|nr:mannose-6-phosphate isomerase, class I [Mobilicoccus sp.]